MLKEEAELRINRFFSSYPSYRLNKQRLSQQAISISPASKLLEAFDIRFQCMKAVAAAKFPENRPINVPEQIEKVISNIKNLAQEKGIVKHKAIAAIEQLFRQNIVLAERIQTPYHWIWNKSYQTAVDNQLLINNAYEQLRHIISKYNLPLNCNDQKSVFEPDDVLGLARDVIGHASTMIINVLAESESLANEVLQKEFSEAFVKMLAVYMTPGYLSKSNDDIEQMVQNISHSSIQSMA